jgi:molybdenum cofactor synthesis domain-containing protein
MSHYKAYVIISSDRAAQGIYEDRSGPAVVEWLTRNQYRCENLAVVPDLREPLVDCVAAATDASSDLVIISGGTGLGPRDITPQVLASICDYEIPGFGELMRKESLKYSLNAYLSRCGGFVKQRSLILAVPGNPKAAVEQLEALADLLPQAIESIHGRCKHRRRVENTMEHSSGHKEDTNFENQ